MGRAMWVTEAKRPTRTLASMTQRSRGAKATRSRAGRDGGVHAHHEGATLKDIAQGDEEEEAAGIANLRRHGDKAYVRFRRVEGAGHLSEEGLVVVNGGDAYGTGEAEERQWRTLTSLSLEVGRTGLDAHAGEA